jgi:hypothetical protein
MFKGLSQILVHIAFLLVVFEKTCKLSVVVYFGSLLFYSWKFETVFFYVLIFVTARVLLVMYLNRDKLNAEFNEVFEKLNKELNNKK